MNIIDVQDQLKNFSEQQLISEMQMPTGSAPQFLVLSEIKRRKRVRDDFMKREAANQPTVAEEAIAAAGVPQSGIMGMSEAMAPQAAVAEGGIGSIMPQSMRPQAMPAPTDDAIPMAEGGIIHAQKGTYFPSTEELYGIYGQESGFGKNLFGSSGEIGPYQILPTTAIMPGFGITSMFPELEAAVARGDYENAQEAYLANKDAVDEALMSGQRSEGFVKSYLDSAESELGDRNKALLSFNQGIPGTRNFEGDATGTDYVSGVLGNQSGYQEAVGEGVLSNIASTIGEALIPSASASTITNMTEVDDSQPMPEIPSQIIRDSQGRVIGDASYGPRIRAAMETGNVDIADNLVAQGVNEANFFERMMADQDPDDLGREASGMGALNAPGLTSTLDPSQVTEVLPLDVTQKGPSGQAAPVIKDTQTPTDSETDTGGEDESNLKFSPQPAGGTSSLQQEIIDLQKQMKKDRETDKYLALAQAGLALMSSKEPTLLGAIGEAGVGGLSAYREAQDRYNEGVVDLINARAKIAKGGADPFDASNAVTRLGQIERALGGADGMSLPDVDRDRLMNEKLVLSRFLEELGLPGFATGSKPTASQKTPAS